LRGLEDEKGKRERDVATNGSSLEVGKL